MNIQDLEPGMVCKGINGSIREILWIKPGRIRYQLLIPRHPLGTRPYSCGLRDFAAWATEDVTETWRAA